MRAPRVTLVFHGEASAAGVAGVVAARAAETRMKSRQRRREELMAPVRLPADEARRRAFLGKERVVFVRGGGAPRVEDREQSRPQAGGFISWEIPSRAKRGDGIGWCKMVKVIPTDLHL